MIKRVFILYLLFFFGVSKVLLAQGIFDKVKINAEAGAVVSSTNTTPFLMRSNQYGLIPLSSQYGYINGSFRREYDSTYNSIRKLNHFSFGYGAELQTNFGAINQILLPQIYVKARFKAVQIYVGRRKEIQGLVDTLGTMGSYIWSGNALPLPKIDISIPNFTPITKNGLISIKGNFAHGWFGSTDSVKNYFLHQKSIYLRLGKPKWRFKFLAGINHQVQWGGKPAVPYYDKISNQIISDNGNDFKTFINVVTGLSMARGGSTISNQTGVASNEAGNRSGNHLGSVDIGLEYQGDIWKFFIYRQSVYDDGSLFYLNNISDGLNGLSISKSKGFVRKICIEYLNTTNQGGPYFSDIRNELRGLDNYFNNSIFKDGWTYKGQTIGTPQIISMDIYGKFHDVSTSFQNQHSSSFLIVNRVKALNVSLYYYLNNLRMKTQFVSSQNLGNYAYKMNLNQYSILQSFDFNYGGLFVVRPYISGDFGQLYKPSIGFRIAAVKTWN